MTEEREVARVISPRINIGRWCAFLAIVMWYGGNAGAWNFVRNLPGGRAWAMLYIFLEFGFAIRAGHDLLMWLAQANDALNEKRKFESTLPTNKKPEISEDAPRANAVHPWMSTGFLEKDGWLEDARRSHEAGGMTDEEWQHTLRIADYMQRQKSAEKLPEPR